MEFAARKRQIFEEDVEFKNGQVRLRDHYISFEELIQQAYFDQVSLSSTGFYRTPKIYYDRSQARAAVLLRLWRGLLGSDRRYLTGEYKMLRSDILHDVGASLNPAIDIGQVEGGFVQGLGWLTMEELVWNDKGKLMTNGPASYKIPAVADMPLDLRVKLVVENRKNPEDTVFHQGRGRAAVHARHFGLVRDQGCGGEPADYRAQPQIDARRPPSACSGAWNRCAG